MKRFDSTGGFTKGLATSVPMAWLGTNCGLDPAVLTLIAGGITLYRAALFPPKPQPRAITHRRMFSLGLVSGMAFGLAVNSAAETGLTADASDLLTAVKSSACELLGCPKPDLPKGIRVVPEAYPRPGKS